MTIYNYDLSHDFVNGVNPTCLDRTIDEYGFSAELLGVNIEWGSDEVTINFDGDLSTSDKEDLDTIISSHNPLYTCDLENNATIIGGGTKVDFILAEHSSHEYIYCKSTSWTIATSFIFEGSFNWQPLKFSVIASLKSTGSGIVRLYDQTNNNEICSIEWTNQNKHIASTETFYNIPTAPALIELQYKATTKNKDARLHYAAIY